MNDADELWHLVSIHVHGSEFHVLCVPHGDVSTHSTWFDAVIGHYAHDYAFKGNTSLDWINSPATQGS